jgi:hypothetical protein
MAPDTCCLHCLLRNETISAQNILALTDRFKMVWVHAVPYPTQMVQCTPRWYWTPEYLVDDAMNESCLVVNAQHAISIRHPVSRPQPASSVVLGNFGEDSLDDRIPVMASANGPACCRRTRHFQSLLICAGPTSP